MTDSCACPVRSRRIRQVISSWPLGVARDSHRELDVPSRPPISRAIVPLRHKVAITHPSECASDDHVAVCSSFKAAMTTHILAPTFFRSRASPPAVFFL